MMKNNRFRAILMAVLMLGFVANAFAGDTAARLVYSLDRGFGITGSRGNVGTPLKQDYDVAIRINDKHFVGMTIAAVRVPIDTMRNLSGLKVWLSKELTLEVVDGKKVNKPDILSQDAEMGQGWVEVALDKPYTITDEGVYVGYSFKMDEMDNSNRRPVRITTELHEG